MFAKPNSIDTLHQKNYQISILAFADDMTQEPFGAAGTTMVSRTPEPFAGMVAAAPGTDAASRISAKWTASFSPASEEMTEEAGRPLRLDLVFKHRPLRAGEPI